MRRHRSLCGRNDGNQALVVRELRKLGISVEILSEIGNGCPDLLLGYSGKMLLVELKDPTQPPSKRRLTDDEEIWRAAWNGTLPLVAETVDDIVKVL